ncbi:uncharacterized protein LOC128279072 [Anopheles cruzii]|uniref:uncharacterized protein LOC128279072 n=1 Tax=Anopheles cruzii TaxID=68878 RepID=UPI0022EC9497|nr:uncharacterized protein LOC128279072 [Anopheles cruzii]
MDITKQKIRNEKLNQEQSLQLIEQVKQYPELWCKTYKHYRNINRQESAWVRLSRELAISATNAKYNWSALLANFRVYRAKVKKSQLTASGHDDIYRPCWFAYESMLFVSEASDVVEATHTIGLARPTSHSHSAKAMQSTVTSINRQQSTVTSQVPCSSQNSSPLTG